ncbi:MAG: CCA tRNA nucleotidyltransferase [Candidatus Levybacteria bacterium]|nr:CCA tRNA nucleotidyltransferase [Candidatus Levybacteria bacterium]
MIDFIPSEIVAVYKKLVSANFDVYFVGGCVRNLLMKKPVKDWDLTTNAVPEELLKIFPDGFYDNQFGTVGVPIEIENEKHIVEITTFRTETAYSDKRRPDKVKWGKTIEEDLARRDFTINAIALKLPSSIIDPYEGQEDIQARLIRAVGDPKLRFKEDALRLMRAVRIATELGFTIEEQTCNEIQKDAKLITHVSGERIRVELLRILSSEYPYDGIMLLRNALLLEQILPELLEGVGVSQVRPGRHHTTDVFTHNMLSLKFCPSKDPIVRFTTLLHDVGKPKVKGEDQEGLVIFHNHEIVGTRIAKDICDRLKFSKKDRDKVVTLIRWHMFTVDEKSTDAAIRRFIRRVGIENIQDMLDLRVADRLGSGTKTAESWRLKLFKERVEKELAPAAFSINDLSIDGNDVMRELNIKPGPKVGEILQKLFEEVDADLSKNTKEYLIKRIHEYAKFNS